MQRIRVHMVREDLRGIPRYDPPTGYRMRSYRPGDDRIWLRVCQACWLPGRVTRAAFQDAFGADLRAMDKRSFFLVAPDGEDVGTATAWYWRYRGRRWGRLHWVAVLPKHQGRGLSRCLVSAAMERLRQLGHRRARLTSETQRIAAIRTYLRFGFVPDMTAPDAERAWCLVRGHISHPAIDRARVSAG